LNRILGIEFGWSAFYVPALGKTVELLNILLRDTFGFGARFLSAAVFYCQPRMMNLSRKAKKAEGLEQHKKLQREKDQKRKERKQVSLPSKLANKGKK
jgi:hypothetical protein